MDSKIVTARTMSITCPFCEAEPGQSCKTTSASGRAGKPGKPGSRRVTPHQGRVMAAMRGASPKRVGGWPSPHD